MPSSSLRQFARRLTRPLTSPLDGRVADINRRVSDTRDTVEEQSAATSRALDGLTHELAAYASTAVESNSFVGVEMRRMEESFDALRSHVDEHELRIQTRLDDLEERAYFDRLNRVTNAPLEQLDGVVANLINHAEGHSGFAAQAGLWFNPPVTVELREGCARFAGVNERIVEVPFAMGALARVPPPARILDIGSAESTFPLSAAALGYEVTAVDLRSLPYSHPHLTSVATPFQDWDAGAARFDAAFLISTIEHFGLGAYGEPVEEGRSDRAAITRIGELLDDGGFLVLTTPYGYSSIDALERRYDEQGIAALLDGWEILDRRTAVRRDERTWTADEPGKDDEGVVMIIASPCRTG